MFSKFLLMMRDGKYYGPLIASYLAVAFVFVVNILMARMMGAQDFGVISIIIGWALLAATLGHAGMPALSLREMSSIDQSTHLKAGLVPTALMTVTLCTLTVGIPIAVAYNLTSGAAFLPNMLSSVAIVGLALASVYITLMSVVWRTMELPILSVVIDKVWRPAGFLVVLAVFFGSGLNSDQVIIGMLGFGLICAAAMAAHIHTRFADLTLGKIKDIPGAMKAGWSFWVSRFSPNVIKRSDIIILGLTQGPVATALYVVAQRFSELGTIAGASLNTIIGPKMSLQSGEADASVKKKGQIALLKESLILSILLGVPACLIIGVASDFALALMGQEFRSAKTALIILLVASLVVIAGRPSALLLGMSGREGVVAKINFVALVIHVILFSALSIIWGLEGAAFARLITLCGAHGSTMFVVFRSLKAQ